MKSKVMIIAAILAMALMAAPALATTITFSVSGFDTYGDPIAAIAKFTTGADTVTVDIWNTQANIKSVGQDISDLGFVLTTGQTIGSISSFSATARTIDSTTKAYTDTAAVTSHWHLDNGVSFGAFGAGLKLNDLGGGMPKNTIIGPPAGDNLYHAANSSITGATHSPEWFGDATTPVEFVVSVPGVTAASRVTFAQFSFGTTAGDNHNGVPSAPVPPSVLLLGSGLIGLGLVRWRRR